MVYNQVHDEPVCFLKILIILVGQRLFRLTSIDLDLSVSLCIERDDLHIFPCIINGRS